MHYFERQKLIMNMLEARGFVSVREMAACTGMSMDSIRRDLRMLQKSGQVEMVHGGAVLPRKLVTNRAYEERKKRNQEAKQEIAQKALRFVTHGQSIALNAGTTNDALASALIEVKHQLCVWTNGVPILEICGQRKDYEVHILSGIYDPLERSIYPEHIQSLQMAKKVDLAFITVNALSHKKGVTDFRKGELQMITYLMHQAEQVILLADHSKFETESNYLVCNYHQVSCIITDKKLNPNIRNLYTKQGISIV